MRSVLNVTQSITILKSLLPRPTMGDLEKEVPQTIAQIMEPQAA